MAAVLVAFVSLLSLVIAEEGPTTAALDLAQAIEAQDVCQSLGKDCDYALELLQKQVSRRAAPQGWTKQSSSAALPPIVAPEFLETISDLGVEVRTGDQQAAGFGVMIEDIQEGLNKAIDVADEVSVSRHQSLADIKGRSLSIDSATQADFATKNTEVEAQLAEMAGDVHLHANRIAEQVKNVQREFQDLGADLNQIQLGNMRVGDLGVQPMIAMTSNAGNWQESLHASGEEALSVKKASRYMAKAVTTHAMEQAITSGDRMRAEEDLQREMGQVQLTHNSVPSDKDLFQNSQNTMKMAAVQKKPGMPQDGADSFSQQERRAGAVAVKVLEAAAGTDQEEKQVATAAAAVKSARENVKEMLAKHAHRAVGIAQAVEDATDAMKARDQQRKQAMLNSMPKEAAAKTAKIDIQNKAAVAGKQEAVVGNRARAFAELNEEKAMDQSKIIAALQKQHFAHEAFPADHGTSRVFASPQAVEVAAKVVSAPWVDAARRAEEIIGAATADRMTGIADAMGSVATLQRKPTGTTNSVEFSKEQGRAEAAAQEALDAPTQTMQEEEEVAAAAAAVEEARKRVKMQLVHHTDVYPSIVESEEETETDDHEMTPKEVAEKWMDSIVQDNHGEIAEVQRKPAVSQVATVPFSKQQRAAATASDQVREAAAQTQHEEDEVKKAVAAVEEARDRVTRRLVNHEDLDPPPKQEKDDTMLTPEEVAEKWMNSIVQSGQVAGMEAM